MGDNEVVSDLSCCELDLDSNGDGVAELSDCETAEDGEEASELVGPGLGSAVI
ncbi:hypothetical protein [Endozoicomonas sp. GU-1]|uniref:hypothetical protein n=1 Tax=Endozoicomonas sp. GU-1 TaxID=3009078 RepID=UPI0022B54DB9|nr:hypothetical protein [Endozoicomonas sp. GU-1]WBA81240.1 hypothetical protein O2T12_23585 [Endozoicomonas sp. GU-1]WBA84186.1 hypothetical protein O3276_12755 [Endozoicomonas sp. GU-1]